MTLCAVGDLLGWSLQGRGVCVCVFFTGRLEGKSPPCVTAELAHGYRVMVEAKAGLAAWKSP